VDRTAREEAPRQLANRASRARAAGARWPTPSRCIASDSARRHARRRARSRAPGVSAVSIASSTASADPRRIRRRAGPPALDRRVSTSPRAARARLAPSTGRRWHRKERLEAGGGTPTRSRISSRARRVCTRTPAFAPARTRRSPVIKGAARRDHDAQAAPAVWDPRARRASALRRASSSVSSARGPRPTWTGIRLRLPPLPRPSANPRLMGHSTGSARQGRSRRSSPARARRRFQ
jgi:hypothetical protein